MEPNPYEPPKIEQPLTRSQIVKRSVALALVMVLTPPAFAAALWSYCSAARAAAMKRSEAGLLILMPPGVLIGMLLLAANVRGKRQGDLDRKRFINEIVAIPLFMVLSFAVGLVLGAFAYFSVSTRGGGQLPGGEWIIMSAFWLLPFSVLAYMLQRAWRYR